MPLDVHPAQAVPYFLHPFRRDAAQAEERFQVGGRPMLVASGRAFHGARRLGGMGRQPFARKLQLQLGANASGHAIVVEEHKCVAGIE